tara:strand:- start:73 stop:693 length:621 start_codon:yes stop_codon:yes gene_type:complete
LVAYIYQKLLDEGVKAGQTPARTRSARNWFRNLARQTTGIQPNTIIKTAPKIQLTRVPQVGFMYHFFYDPKTKDDLPYYDRFPLVFPFKRGFVRQRAIESGSFLGINLHYLPPQLRARLMDGLYTISTDKTFDENTRIRLSYNILNKASKFRFFKPCVKRYLVSKVRSRFVKINADQWDTALFLPTERFVKKSKSYVQRQSRKMLA